MSKKLHIEKKLWTPGLRILKNKIAVHCPWTPWRQTSIFTVHDGSWHKPIKKLQLQKKTSRVIRTFYFHSHLSCKRFHKSFIQNAGCWKAHSQILWTLLRSWTFGLQTYCCGKKKVFYALLWNGNKSMMQNWMKIKSKFQDPSIP